MTVSYEKKMERRRIIVESVRSGRRVPPRPAQSRERDLHMRITMRGLRERVTRWGGLRGP